MTKVLVFQLTEGVLQPRNRVAAFFAWIDRSLGYDDLGIPIVGLDQSADDILAAINRFTEKAG